RCNAANALGSMKQSAWQAVNTLQESVEKSCGDSSPEAHRCLRAIVLAIQSILIEVWTEGTLLGVFLDALEDELSPSHLLSIWREISLEIDEHWPTIIAKECGSVKVGQFVLAVQHGKTTKERLEAVLSLEEHVAKVVGNKPVKNALKWGHCSITGGLLNHGNE